MLITIATTNQGKLKEFQRFFQEHQLDYEFQAINHACFDVEETGDSFAANALLKARAAAQLSQGLCLADDSGLVIPSLGGAPGIFSARYMQAPNGGLEGILRSLKDKEDRQCYFVCNLCLVDSSGNILEQIEKHWHGSIATAPRGSNGFGYDPIVIPNEYPNLTVAELDSTIKNSISHRALALKALSETLQTPSFVNLLLNRTEK